MTYQIKMIIRFKISNGKSFRSEFCHSWDEKNLHQFYYDNYGLIQFNEIE